jgi:hypothetical protein
VRDRSGPGRIPSRPNSGDSEICCLPQPTGSCCFSRQSHTVPSLIAIPMAFVLQWISEGIYVCVALLWLIPDRRIESTLMEKKNEKTSIH